MEDVKANNQHDQTLIVFEEMMQFVLQVYRDIHEGKDTNIESSEEETLSLSLKFIFKQSVLNLNAAYNLGAYMPILDMPDRSEFLKAHLKNVFLEHRGAISDLNFVEWCVACCVINIELFEQGFVEAPSIAIDVMHEMCILDNRSEIFSWFGCKL